MKITLQSAARVAAISLTLLVALAGRSASAQLPESFNGWDTKVVRAITAPQLPQFAQADAAIVGEYGFDSGEYRSYQKDGADLTVTLWKMTDATGAYGLYSFYREPGTAVFDGKDPVAVWSNRLLVQHGPYVVDARGGNFTMGDAKLLIARIPTLRGNEATLPNLPGYFPETNMLSQTQRYVIGPKAFERFVSEIEPGAIGFETGAEAEVAQYSINGAKPRLLMISYATPQLAIKKGRELAQFHAKDGGELFVERKSSLVAVVIAAGSAEVAKALVRSIPYQPKVTWNQYVPTKRDNIGNLVINAFLLIAIILMFSLVAGLSFGGIRVLSKKFLRTPVFDRPSQMEIIRLHLSDQ